MRSEQQLLPGDRREADGGPGLVAAFTLVVWAGCVVVGAAGLLSRPAGMSSPPATQPAATVVSVELEATPAPPAATPQVAAATPQVAAATPAAAAVDTPRRPPVPAAAIAFAVPLAGPVGVAPPAAAAPAVARLSYGQGEGRQPAPEYPAGAVAAGQQGRVLVRFGVDADGRVTDAWAAAPSPFPLLNRSAVTAVRDTWHFRAGPTRMYEVPITFQLNGPG